MIRRAAAFAVLFGVLLVSVSATMACPVCHTETGKKVRAGIFSDEFVSNAAMTLLPFPVLIAAAALIHFGPPRWLGATRPETHEPTHR
jgi:hypothetical protein